MRTIRSLTYPRTDSRYLSSDIVPSIKGTSGGLRRGSVPEAGGTPDESEDCGKKKAVFVDDKKVSDHHAIIPTEQFVQLDHMTVEERKIYDLVVRRFIAVLYPPFRV